MCSHVSRSSSSWSSEHDEQEHDGQVDNHDAEDEEHDEQVDNHDEDVEEVEENFEEKVARQQALNEKIVEVKVEEKDEEDDEGVDKHDEDEEEDEGGEPATKKTKVVTPEPEAVPPEQPGPPGPPQPMVEPLRILMGYCFKHFVGFVVDHPYLPPYLSSRRSLLAPSWFFPGVEWTPARHYEHCDPGCPCCRFAAGDAIGYCPECCDAWMLTTVNRHFHNQCREYVGEATYQSWRRRPVVNPGVSSEEE